MKKFIDLLTNEQKEELKNCYLVTSDNELWKLTQDNGDELTPESFKVLVKGEEGFVIANIDNISFYEPENEDFDFKVMDESEILGWFRRNATLESVVEFLDKELNKAQYEEE